MSNAQGPIGAAANPLNTLKTSSSLEAKSRYADSLVRRLTAIHSEQCDTFVEVQAFGQRVLGMAPPSEKDREVVGERAEVALNEMPLTEALDVLTRKIARMQDCLAAEVRRLSEFC